MSKPKKLFRFKIDSTCWAVGVNWSYGRLTPSADRYLILWVFLLCGQFIVDTCP